MDFAEGHVLFAGSEPWLLLLHQCNADHQVYDQLGTMLSTAGYKCLPSIFAASVTARAESSRILKSSDRNHGKDAGDVDAALTFLTSRNS